MQINRLFEIVYLLLDKKTLTAKALAQRFEVSSRTIYRDIETLSAAGIPVYMTKGKGGGISLLSDFVLNKAVLTETEKRDILSSLKAVTAINLSETDSALQKLSSLFGEANTDWIEVDFSTWSNGENETAIFNQVKAAILAKEVVSFSYASGRRERLTRKVEPLKLCFKGGAWYLYGYCHGREDYRFFKLKRMRELVVSAEHFLRESPEQIFNLENPFQEEFINLKLRLAPELAYRVYDDFEDYEIEAEGSFVVETYYPKGEWIFYYITSFGEYCEVLEPPEVREAMKIKLQATLLHYL